MIPCGVLPAFPTVPAWTEWVAAAAYDTVTPPADMAGWWAWVVVLGLVAVIDTWLLHRHKNTMSQKVLKWARRLQWFRVLGVSIMVIFTWHLFWGLWL